jgi:hypothetical protein
MAGYEWRTFLDEFGRELLEDEDLRDQLPDEAVASGWLGFGAATESEIQALQHRLSVQLPPSYRNFLATSDGWRTTGWAMVRLLPVREVGWLRDIDPELIKIWEETAGSFLVSDEEYFVFGRWEQEPHKIRTEYLRDMLVISDRGTTNVDHFWLNPRVIFDDGEWEAWHFSPDFPGAFRSRSFWELMQRQREEEHLRRD